MKSGLYLVATVLFFVSSHAHAADCNTLSGNQQRTCRDNENKSIEAAIKQKTQNLYPTIYAACKADSVSHGSGGPAAIDEALICSQIKLGKILDSFK